jgi:hypothetical protein
MISHLSARIAACLCLCLLCAKAFPQTPDSIRVLIIYGSEPAKGHPHEYKWFGGRPGGHVALQLGRDRVLSFAPTKYHPWCHIFPSSKHANFKSTFRTESVGAFWETFNYTGGRYHIDSLKRLVVVIPITARQRKMLDSLSKAYLTRTPYDYAVVGMRCASATYEIIARLGVLDHPYKDHIWWHLLWPRDIRYELLKEARYGPKGKTWRIYQGKGSTARNWDYDRKI